MFYSSLSQKEYLSLGVRGFLSVLSVGFRFISIYGLKKGRDSGATRASQSENLCRTNPNLSDKGTARSHLAMGKIRGGESLTEVPKILHYGFRAGLFPVQYYNRFGTKKIHRCGLERTGADIETEAFYPVVYCVRNKRKRL